VHGRSLLLLAALGLAACASPSARSAILPAPATAACPPLPDVPGLLAWHARAFGSRETVSRALPRSFAGEVVIRGTRGTAELVIGREGRFSRTTTVGGMRSASGVDAAGPWVLPQAGVLLRLRDDEGVEPAFESWLARRDYLVAFDPARDVATYGRRRWSPALRPLPPAGAR